MISQGTVSVLCGCHSVIHTIFVILAWKALYREWPNWKEIICILFHDIGHLGKNYLDNYEEKCKHWELGARICGRLFGDFGRKMVAGHCPMESGYPPSLLQRADKYSRVIQPLCFFYWDGFVEPKLRHGMGIFEHAKVTKREVIKFYDKNKDNPDKTMHDVFLNKKKM
jgi:hypothetical protein